MLTGIFPLCSTVPECYAQQAAELRREYRPHEVDPNLTRKEKSSFMEEWIRKEADLIHFELDHQDIRDAVVKARVAFRYNIAFIMH